MMNLDSEPVGVVGAARQFHTTHWSVVLTAVAESPEATVALQRLCTTYWYPLYGFLRQDGHSHADAQDLTQSLFARLIENGGLRSVDPHKGRFRSFLLASLRHLVSNERAKSRTWKRGGGVDFVWLDAEVGEARYRRELATEANPETAYVKRWAMTLLETVLKRLGDEYAAAGKADLFAQLNGFLTDGQNGVAYAEVSRRLVMSEGAVKMAVLRMRRRFAELLRAEVAVTVADPGEVDEEIRSLFAALADGSAV